MKEFLLSGSTVPIIPATMMETCISYQDDTREQETTQTDPLRRDLSSELGSFTVSQHSSIEEREHLRVYLRIRPLTSAENDNGESQDCVTIQPPDTVLLKPPSWSLSARLGADKSLPQTGQRFQFSQVYGPQTTQSELFRGTVKDMVKDVLEGGNSLVFTYGVTNAGKTFTFLGPDADAGILPRSLDVIFSSIEKQVFTGMSIKPHRCREFTRLTREQQAEEAMFKRNLFRQLKESAKINISLLNSTNKNLHEDCTMLEMTVGAEDRISLEVDTLTKFSVWVSFCEIYNENIHDLLEVAPSGGRRRTALRLSQDVKGNAFVKDLHWVQVNSAEEAYMVMKLGKKNQSFSSTRLNQLSSRSHSIFSIRIMRIENVGTPRVNAVSELSLCDLAGSERCAKTQNIGKSLKEAGNINTSLLILGKCIHALRHNQQAKFLQHVPFRESKLTHYLQGFFSGRGKACMIVNINQCASVYDETLNVLRFSAVAQKVLVLSTRPISVQPQRSTSEVSFINSAEREGHGDSRRSSLFGWDSSLEDVQEDEECEEEMSLIEDTMAETNDEEDNENDEKILISKRSHQRQVALVKELQLQLKEEQMESLHMEARVREDISREFSALFSEMQNDHNERLVREREILEERAERRLEIFKDLIDKMATAGPSSDTQVISEMERAEVFVQLQTAQAQLDEHSTEIQEKTSQILTLKHEVQSMEQETQTSASSDGLTDQLREVSQLREIVAEEQEKSKSKNRQMQKLEHKLAQAKELLANKQLFSDEQLQQLTEKLIQQEAESKQQAEELRRKLHEQRELSQQQLGKIRFKCECQEHDSREEVKQLRTTLEEQKQALERQVEELNEKLREQEMISQQQLKDLKDLKDKLSTQKTNSGEALDLKLHHVQREDTTDKGSNGSSSSVSEEDLKRLNSVLQAEVASLKAKVSEIEETKESPSKTKALLDSLGSERMLSQLEKVPSEKEAELQKKLLEREAQVTSLQKSLQKVQERQLEEENQAVQDTRRREVERRRELLAVAHEAIAQKDEELKKKAEEINSLKENAKQDLEKVKSLGLDLQRKEDDLSDLKEKLADYKKQIHQVQNEISFMREEGKVFRQKLSDMEKAKKCLQSDLTNRDKTIQQLKADQSCNMSDQTLELYQKACKDLEATQRVVEDMRLALMEQEETQNQMEQVLEEKLNLIQELSSEVEKLKGVLLQLDRGNGSHRHVDSQSEDLKVAKQDAARAQESLKLCTEKHQAERRKWLEEKLSLVSQAKEAEDKRNQEMRKFVEDRERFTQQQSQLESLSSQMAEKEETMERWRKERDTLVAALEVQLQKLLSNQAEKDNLIQQLRQSNAHPPQEAGVDVAELLAALSEKEAEILRLKEEIKASTGKKEDMFTQTKNNENTATLVGKPQSKTSNMRSGGKRDTRASVSSQSSAGCPSVLDSSEISTENGRASRFPRPELEISFSPLQPNRMALRRQGEDSAVTIKITRPARKRKSGEMDKSHIFRRSKRRAKQEEEVEAQNRRNMRTKLTPKLTPHQEEISSPAGRHDSPSSVCSRKEGTLQKIGEFLQSSPTLLSTKAKMMMGLVSGRGGADAAASSSSLSLRAKKSKRKLYRPEISSPIDMPSHPIISREPEEKESSHQILKRRLRSRMAK